MSGAFIASPEFIKNLDEWLFKNDQKYADFLYRNKSNIPQYFRSYAKPLYRGMSVNADFVNTLLTKGVTFDKHTSWTQDQKMAEKFANDPAFSTGKTSGETKILIKKGIPATSIILDIYGFVNYMGVGQLGMLGFDETSLDSAMKEKEVLISKGVKITKSNVVFL